MSSWKYIGLSQKRKGRTTKGQRQVASYTNIEGVGQRRKAQKGRQGRALSSWVGARSKHVEFRKSKEVKIQRGE